MNRFVLDEDAPNNTAFRHYGVFDNEENRYVAYGKTYEEALDVLESLTGGTGGVKEA